MMCPEEWLNVDKGLSSNTDFLVDKLLKGAADRDATIEEISVVFSVNMDWEKTAIISSSEIGSLKVSDNPPLLAGKIIELT